MRNLPMTLGLSGVALGLTVLSSGLLLGAPAAASASGGASASATPSSVPATCPPAPATQRDKGDLGFIRVTPVAGTSAGVPIVTQPFTLELVCFDKMTQHATVSFTGQAPTGRGVAVPILKGQASFEFTGHQSPDVVDASQTYRLDVAALGAPASDGWHVKALVVIAEDRSASRQLPIIISVPEKPTPTPTPTPSASVTPSATVTPTPAATVLPTAIVTASPTPTPSAAVLPTKASRTPSPTPTTAVEALHEVTTPPALPFTGARDTRGLTALGACLVVIGGLLAFGSRRRGA